MNSIRIIYHFKDFIKSRITSIAALQSMYLTFSRLYQIKNYKYRCITKYVFDLYKAIWAFSPQPNSPFFVKSLMEAIIVEKFLINYLQKGSNPVKTPNFMHIGRSQPRDNYLYLFKINMYPFLNHNVPLKDYSRSYEYTIIKFSIIEHIDNKKEAKRFNNEASKVNPSEAPRESN